VSDAVAIASKSHRYLLSTASSVATRYRNINVIALIGAEVCCRTSHGSTPQNSHASPTDRSFIRTSVSCDHPSIIFGSEFFAQAAGFLQRSDCARSTALIRATKRV